MKRLAVAAFTALSALGVVAGPSAARGQGLSVTVSFAVTIPAKNESGETRTGTRQVRKTFYLSTAGRAFVRSERQAGRRSEKVERGPNEIRGAVALRGNTFTGTLPFQSGASQILVTLDPSRTSCSATVSRTGERPPDPLQGARRVDADADRPATVSAVSCNARADNAFAEEARRRYPETASGNASHRQR